MKKMFEPDRQSIERMKVCLGCEHFFKPTKQCKKCGCFMPIKVRLRTQKCPVGKWGEELDSNPESL